MYNGFSKSEIQHLMISKPYFAQIELTRNCNFACKFCFENCDYQKKYKDEPLSVWKSAIDKLYEIGVKYLHFSGGENFLYKDFLNLIKYCSNKKFKILINTNGSFPIDNVIDYVDDFVFSVHGLDKVHDEIVNSNLSFQKVLKNIEKACNAGKNVIINTVLIKENFENFQDIYYYFKNRFKEVKYAPTLAIPCKTGTRFDDSILDINSDVINKFNSILHEIGEENIVYKHGFYGLQKSLRNEHPFNMPVCAAGKSKMIIKYNGNVYPCNFFQTDDYLCGNIFEDDVFDIWNNGKGFKEFRKIFFDENIPDKCRECSKKTNCFSGCKAWTKNYINGETKLFCERDVRCEVMDAFIRNRNNDKM